MEDPLLPPPYIPLTPQTPAQPVPDPLPDSPPLAMSPTPPHEPDSSPEPVGRQLCSVKQSHQLAAAHQMAFQDTQGPQQVKEDGSVQPDHYILYYHRNPAYSDKPQAVTDLLESIFHTHQPTWDDCRQLLMSVFTTEVLNAVGWAREAMPETKRNWDFNTRQGQETLGRYHDAALHGLRAEAKKPTNMSKITTIIQKADEIPPPIFMKDCMKRSGHTPHLTLREPKIKG